MDPLLDTAPCGFLTFTDDGTLVQVNTSLLDWLGYARDELEGRPLETILPIASRIFYQTHLFPLLTLHGRVEEVYFPLRDRDGADIPMLANAVRLTRQGGMVNDCVLVPMRQRTRYEEEILQAKQIAEEASRLKDEFLATVSHELRTPLTSILGWVHLLRTRQHDPQKVAQAVEVIERNARSQAQLIDDLLDVSRIILGKMRLDVQPLDLGLLIEAAIESVRPAAEAKGVRLQKTLDTGVGAVSGDAARLQQVVWNLLSNAVKFTPKGGRVQVRLERINSHVEITVSDSGIGIRPEFLPHVFERFRQADQTMRRQQGGLGLGLAIVRHLVELHGGEVGVESPGEGQGTTFRVVLPIMIVHQAARGPQRVHPRVSTRSGPLEVMQRLDGVRILVVDDEADTRDLLATLLRQYGAQVTTAHSAQAALQAIVQQPSDVLVSDIGMPGEDGYALIRQIRSLPATQGGQTPAVALSAYARPEDRIQALQAGYQTHLAKPVEPAELVAVIASLASNAS
jgi:PAS domain S-box-containing protein